MDGAGNGTLNPLVGDERPGDSSLGRTAFVLIEELLSVLGGLTLVLHLGRHGPNLRSAHGDQLRRPWPGLDAASSTVIGDTRSAVVVYDDGAVVHVSDSGDIDPVDGAVVIEVIAAPVATVVTVACIAVAIRDAAVEAYVKAPVAAIEAIAVAVKTPVSGSPERTLIRSGDPCARHPVITYRGIVPISGSPEVIGSGSFGLLVGWQGRRRLVRFFDGLLTGIDLVVVVLIVVILIVRVALIALVLNVLIVCIGGVLVLSWRLRATLLVLLCLLLTFVFLALFGDRCLGWGCSGALLVLLICLLGLVYRGHVRVRWVRAGIARHLARGRLPVAT